MAANKRRMVVRISVENDPENPDSSIPVVTGVEMTDFDGSIVPVAAEGTREGQQFILHLADEWGLMLTFDTW